MEPMDEGLFNEWLLYDFIFPNGRTMLEDFVARNPLKLNLQGMVLYKDILSSHAYGLFEVLAIAPGDGLVLGNAQTGEELEVRERKLTYQIVPGNAFFGRTGKVEDHFELIGAASFIIPNLDADTRSALHNSPARLTSKTAYDLSLRKRRSVGQKNL